MRKRDHNLFTNAVSLLVCGVLAGVVVAAAVFPAVAIGALASKAGADSFAELPSELEVPTPPQISYLYARDDRTLIGTFYDENRHDIPLSEIPQVMRDAIVAAEDGRFYEHRGVDIQGVARAYLANELGSSDLDQGASTLTMQYVRQALTYGAVNPEDVLAATETTPQRKIREMRLAIELEKRLTKEQILQNYLNIAAFGNGAYGIYAASQVYFNKEPKDLTLAEAAMLAGLPKAPSDYNPSTVDGMPRALERRAYVLDRMVDLGMISRQQADLAEESVPEITGTRTPRDCTATLVNHWGFFCDFFYRWWLEQDEFGPDELARNSKLKSGGFRITTTLDVGVQDSAKNNIEAQLPTGNRDALMLAAIEPGSGYVRALAANRNFSVDARGNGTSSDSNKAAAGIPGTFPNTTNQLLAGGGDVVGYMAGSTFKLFTMLAALEKGYPLDFTIHARSPYVSPIYKTSPTDEARCQGDKWCPRNANPGWMNGSRNMWTGFGRSVNTYFIPLQEKVGAENVVAMAQKLGIQFRSSVDQDQIANQGGHWWGPFTIGVSDTVPLELANAYATVAAEGLYCEPMPVEKLVDADGVLVPEPVAPRCEQAISADVARAAVDAARCPVNAGSGKCGGGGTGLFGNVANMVGHPVMGKTGTSDFNWTGNYVVSTRQLTIATVFADPDYPRTKHGGEAGRTTQNAANAVLRDAMVGLPQMDWPAPPQNLVVGVKVSIPDVKCKSEDQAKAALQRAGFDVYVDSSRKVESACPPGTVATTDPTGSTSKGSTVTLLISSGPGEEPPPPPTNGGGGGGGGGGDDDGGGNGGIVLPPPVD